VIPDADPDRVLPLPVTSNWRCAGCSDLMLVDVKTLLTGAGIVLTIVGGVMVWKYSPQHFSIIDANVGDIEKNNRRSVLKTSSFMAVTLHAETSGPNRLASLNTSAAIQARPWLWRSTDASAWTSNGP